MFEKETYKDKVKKFVYQMILKGEFLPGKKIKENSIAEALNISRAPIREAFSELIADRILEYKPHKGTFLRKLTPKEIINIYVTRGILEGFAVAESIFKLTDEDFEELNILTANMYESAKNNENEKLIEIGDKFHEILFSKCDNELLVLETKKLSFRSHILFSQNWTGIYTPNEIRKRHNIILKVITEEDKAKTENTIREHYFETGKKIALSIM
jgi:DNA-binding GntR family transcriptional regulator